METVTSINRRWQIQNFNIKRAWQRRKVLVQELYFGPGCQQSTILFERSHIFINGIEDDKFKNQL